MKSKVLFSALSAFVLLAVAAPILMSSERPLKAVDANYDLAGSSANYYLYPTSTTGYESVTITDAGNDTTTLGANLLSRWSYCWHINSTQSSGTESVIAILQETNNASASQATPTDWIEVDRDTLTANEDLRMTGDIVYGAKQRLILDGSGTQSTAITLKFIGKKF